MRVWVGVMPQMWAVSDLQYDRSLSSLSCFVVLCDLIISLPTSFLCDSAVLGLHAFLPTNPSTALLSLFNLIISPYFLAFSFCLRKKKKLANRKETKSEKCSFGVFY